MTTGSLELQGRRSQLLTTNLTKRAYDLTAPFYPMSTMLFHSKAHRRLVELAGPLEGLKVLEVAMGSGELFQKLLARNHRGLTAGVDLSPGMVALVRKRVENGFARSGRLLNGSCMVQAVDACQMPYPSGFFDCLFNAYLFELLQPNDIDRAMRRG